MPRMSASDRPVVSRPVTRPRAKKATIPQDRLTARTLFLRRVKRNLKPGLWVMGGVAVLIVGSELFRSLPTITPTSKPVAVRHSGFGMAELAAGAGLRISKVEILGAHTTDKGQLQAAIDVQIGEPSLGFSLTAVKQRVEQLGPVQSVTVERELPGTLIVNVTERAAYAIWQIGTGAQTKFLLIDKAGNVIANQDATAAKRREPGLLLLVGADAPETAHSLMTELQAAPSVLSHVAAAERVAGLRWNLVLKNQTVVKLPATNESQALTQLGSLQSSMQLLDRPVEVIDLRIPDRLVVRPYPATATTSAKNDHT